MLRSRGGHTAALDFQPPNTSRRDTRTVIALAEYLKRYVILRAASLQGIESIENAVRQAVEDVVLEFNLRLASDAEFEHWTNFLGSLGSKIVDSRFGDLFSIVVDSLFDLMRIYYDKDEYPDLQTSRSLRLSLAHRGLTNRDFESLEELKSELIKVLRSQPLGQRFIAGSYESKLVRATLSYHPRANQKLRKVVGISVGVSKHHADRRVFILHKKVPVSEETTTNGENMFSIVEEDISFAKCLFRIPDPTIEPLRKKVCQAIFSLMQTYRTSRHQLFVLKAQTRRPPCGFIGAPDRRHEQMLSVSNYVQCMLQLLAKLSVQPFSAGARASPALTASTPDSSLQSPPQSTLESTQQKALSDLQPANALVPVSISSLDNWSLYRSFTEVLVSYLHEMELEMASSACETFDQVAFDLWRHQEVVRCVQIYRQAKLAHKCDAPPPNPERPQDAWTEEESQAYRLLHDSDALRRKFDETRTEMDASPILLKLDQCFCYLLEFLEQEFAAKRNLIIRAKTVERFCGAEYLALTRATLSDIELLDTRNRNAQGLSCNSSDFSAAGPDAKDGENYAPKIGLVSRSDNEEPSDQIRNRTRTRGGRGRDGHGRARRGSNISSNSSGSNDNNSSGSNSNSGSDSGSESGSGRGSRRGRSRKDRRTLVGLNGSLLGSAIGSSRGSGSYRSGDSGSVVSAGSNTSGGGRRTRETRGGGRSSRGGGSRKSGDRTQVRVDVILLKLFFDLFVNHSIYAEESPVLPMVVFYLVNQDLPHYSVALIHTLASVLFDTLQRLSPELSKPTPSLHLSPSSRFGSNNSPRSLETGYPPDGAFAPPGGSPKGSPKGNMASEVPAEMKVAIRAVGFLASFGKHCLKLQSNQVQQILRLLLQPFEDLFEPLRKTALLAPEMSVLSPSFLAHIETRLNTPLYQTLTYHTVQLLVSRWSELRLDIETQFLLTVVASLRVIQLLCPLLIDALSPHLCEQLAAALEEMDFSRHPQFDAFVRSLRHRDESRFSLSTKTAAMNVRRYAASPFGLTSLHRLQGYANNLLIWRPEASLTPSDSEKSRENSEDPQTPSKALAFEEEVLARVWDTVSAKGLLCANNEARVEAHAQVSAIPVEVSATPVEVSATPLEVSATPVEVAGLTQPVDDESRGVVSPERQVAADERAYVDDEVERPDAHEGQADPESLLTEGLSQLTEITEMTQPTEQFQQIEQSEQGEQSEQSEQMAGIEQTQIEQSAANEAVRDDALEHGGVEKESEEKEEEKEDAQGEDKAEREDGGVSARSEDGKSSVLEANPGSRPEIGHPNLPHLDDLPPADNAGNVDSHLAHPSLVAPPVLDDAFADSDSVVREPSISLDAVAPLAENSLEAIDPPTRLDVPELEENDPVCPAPQEGAEAPGQVGDAEKIRELKVGGNEPRLPDGRDHSFADVVPSQTQTPIPLRSVVGEERKEIAVGTENVMNTKPPIISSGPAAETPAEDFSEAAIVRETDDAKAMPKEHATAAMSATSATTAYTRPGVTHNQQVAPQPQQQTPLSDHSEVLQTLSAVAAPLRQSSFSSAQSSATAAASHTLTRTVTLPHGLTHPYSHSSQDGPPFTTLAQPHLVPRLDRAEAQSCCCAQTVNRSRTRSVCSQQMLPSEGWDRSPSALTESALQIVNDQNARMLKMIAKQKRSQKRMENRFAQAMEATTRALQNVALLTANVVQMTSPASSASLTPNTSHTSHNSHTSHTPHMPQTAHTPGLMQAVAPERAFAGKRRRDRPLEATNGGENEYFPRSKKHRRGKVERCYSQAPPIALDDDEGEAKRERKKKRKDKVKAEVKKTKRVGEKALEVMPSSKDKQTLKATKKGRKQQSIDVHKKEKEVNKQQKEKHKLEKEEKRKEKREKREREKEKGEQKKRCKREIDGTPSSDNTVKHISGKCSIANEPSSKALPITPSSPSRPSTPFTQELVGDSKRASASENDMTVIGRNESKRSHSKPANASSPAIASLKPSHSIMARSSSNAPPPVAEKLHRGKKEGEARVSDTAIPLISAVAKEPLALPVDDIGRVDRICEALPSPTILPHTQGGTPEKSKRWLKRQRKLQRERSGAAADKSDGTTPGTAYTGTPTITPTETPSRTPTHTSSQTLRPSRKNTSKINGSATPTKNVETPTLALPSASVLPSHVDEMSRKVADKSDALAKEGASEETKGDSSPTGKRSRKKRWTASGKTGATTPATPTPPPKAGGIADMTRRSMVQKLFLQSQDWDEALNKYRALNQPTSPSAKSPKSPAPVTPRGISPAVHMNRYLHEVESRDRLRSKSIAPWHR